MLRCKASETARNEAYEEYSAVTSDEDNAADERLSLIHI